MTQPIRHYPVICPICGAKCEEKKHLVRFERRHPKLCSDRLKFNRQLAASVRSVEPEPTGNWRDIQMY